MTSVQIPDDIAHQYGGRARAAACDTETFIRQALISKPEDMDDIEIAVERLAKKQTPIPIEQVMKNLGRND